jgi:hypothetical protein
MNHRNRRIALALIVSVAVFVLTTGCGQDTGVDQAGRCFELAEAGQPEEALIECDSAIEADSADLSARLARAYLFMLEEKYPLAIADTTHVIAADPENGPAFAFRGMMLADLGATEQAKEDLVAAAALTSQGKIGNTRFDVDTAAIVADVATRLEELGSLPAPAPSIDAPVVIQDPWPVGRLYHDNEELRVTVRYVTPPGMKNMSASFVGVHGPGSPWYGHWCTMSDLPATCGSRMYSGFETTDMPLTENGGTLTFVAAPGDFPPADAGSPPSLEGFILCSVEFRLNDGAWGGAYKEQEIGATCWP